MGGASTRMSGLRDFLFEADRLAGGTARTSQVHEQRVFLLGALDAIGRSDLVGPMSGFLDGGDDSWARLGKDDDLVAVDEHFGVSMFGSGDD